MFLNQLSMEEKELFVSLSVHAAESNGDFAEEERSMLQEYCKEMNIAFFDASEVKPMSEIISTYKNSDITVKRIVLLEILGLLYADDVYDEKENKFASEFAVNIGLKEEDVNLDIGKACRNYLNKYSDVTVYMTRTNSKCVKKLKLGDCLTARNHLAKRLSADAKGIINYYKLSAKNIEGDFQIISGKTYFVDKEGNKIAGWVKKDGKWYHFNNKTAVMNKGFFKEAGNKFYLNPKTGEMTSGWFTISGKSYLAKGNGVVVTNQIYTDGVKSYFFKKSGKRKNGWVTYKNAKYYFSKTKGMLKGKQKIKGKRYTFSKKTGKLKKKK